MHDTEKTKEQLLEELFALRQRNAELEKSDPEESPVKAPKHRSSARLSAIVKAFDGFMYVCSPGVPA